MGHRFRVADSASSKEGRQNESILEAMSLLKLSHEYSFFEKETSIFKTVDSLSRLVYTAWLGLLFGTQTIRLSPASVSISGLDPTRYSDRNTASPNCGAQDCPIPFPGRRRDVAREAANGVIINSPAWSTTTFCLRARERRSVRMSNGSIR